MQVELNKTLFNSRLGRIYDGWKVCGSLLSRKLFVLFLTFLIKNAGKNDEYGSVADADALFIAAGDPASEDDPMRKGTCLQVRTIPDARINGIMTLHGTTAMAIRIRIPLHSYLI